MEPIGCPETSEDNYQSTLRTIQKERVSQYRLFRECNASSLLSKLLELGSGDKKE
jgi:hypothetical protein